MIPGIRTDLEWRDRCLRREAAIARVCAMVAPLVALGAMPFLRHAAAYAVNLRQPEAWADWTAWRDPAILAITGASCVLVVGWWLWAGWEANRSKGVSFGFPLAACMSIVLFAVANAALARPHLLRICMEAARARLGPSYSREVVSWRLRALDSSARALQTRIIIAGSSQIAAAIDGPTLQRGLPTTLVEVRSLPGFGAMQYDMAVPEFLTPLPPLAVVCWLSEFDFFREDSLPANRLRSLAHVGGTVSLAQRLGVRLALANRSELADLFAASCAPLWRDRDIWRSLAAQAGCPDRSTDGPAQQDSVAEFQRVVDGLGASVRRTRLLPANFLSFEAFARHLRASGVLLVVLEGCSSPAAMRAYDPAFRVETRERLRAMGRLVGFTLVEEPAVPLLGVGDFRDATHVSAPAAARLTVFLGSLLRRELGAGMGHVE